ncbi:hypothetical protein TNCV_4634891 [Trichonephila clavipes]|nr:hypothetical protein TNCV_4634891 [Trichonephila clavipes]
MQLHRPLNVQLVPFCFAGIGDEVTKNDTTDGKILGGPTGVFGAKKCQIEGFQKGVNKERKTLGKRMCQRRGEGG